MNKKTLVFGASSKVERYSYKAINRLKDKNIDIVAIGNKEDMALGVSISNKLPDKVDNLHTITLYVNPQNQKNYYDSLLNLHPKRIIFNPGTENPELALLAEKQGVEVVEACTLVMLSTGQY